MCSGGSSGLRAVELEFDPPASAWDLCDTTRRSGGHALLFDGGGDPHGWIHGRLVAIEARPVLRVEPNAPLARRRRAVAALGRRIAEHRRAGGGAGTGVVALLSYDLWEASPRAATSGVPALVAWRVSRSVRFTGDGTAVVEGFSSAGEAERWVEDWQSAPRVNERGGGAGLGLTTRATTSLPRDAYESAVKRLQSRIADGEIYQANICQQFRAGYRGDPLSLQRSLAPDHAAAHAAYVEAPGFALVSASPETFLRMREPGRLETWPIKGTRPRGENREADGAAARELSQSEKDRAELVMIVDLERNDLGRVCAAGSVVFGGLQLRTLPTVHHLVASVEGTLRGDVGPAKLIGATFPGGSITGAPKLRAMQLLREVEPVDRGLFTGSLLWFGDDGRLDSSILIRTVVFDGKQVYIGAGGGIVADSDPEAEWRESNHKARFLSEALGFAPEQAV